MVLPPPHGGWFGAVNVSVKIAARDAAGGLDNKFGCAIKRCCLSTTLTCLESPGGLAGFSRNYYVMVYVYVYIQIPNLRSIVASATRLLWIGYAHSSAEGQASLTGRPNLKLRGRGRPGHLKDWA